MQDFGLVQSWVAASSAAWGWQSSKSGATIPKSFGFEAATRYGATNQCYPESDLFEPCQDFNYTCPKCGNTQCDVGEFRAAGGFLSKIFDVQSKRFTTVICTKCQYTEIYRAASSMLGNIFDLFTN